MRRITIDEMRELEQDGKYEWKNIQIYSYSSGGYGTLPKLEEVTNLMFQCLRCNAHYLIESCSNCNCDSRYFIPGGGGIFCSRCEQGITSWSCPECATNNPARKTLFGLKKKDMCFIATAVYEDYDAPEVVLLRLFRDRFLLSTLCGRYFVALYYTIGPVLAALPQRSFCLRKALKRFFFTPLLRHLGHRVALSRQFTHEKATRATENDSGHGLR
jgi:hypothetical protein